jgi:hypothetical protein
MMDDLPYDWQRADFQGNNVAIPMERAGATASEAQAFGS